MRGPLDNKYELEELEPLRGCRGIINGLAWGAAIWIVIGLMVYLGGRSL